MIDFKYLNRSFVQDEDSQLRLTNVPSTCLSFDAMVGSPKRSRGLEGSKKIKFRYFLNSGFLLSKKAEMPSLAASVQAISPNPL